MKIAARNLLATAILNALDDPEAAIALQCLAAYCEANSLPPTAVSVETLGATLPGGQTASTVTGLRRSPLLSWQTQDGKAVAALLAPLAEDYGATVAKLRQYATALTSWRPDPYPDDIRTVVLHKAAQLFNHHLFFEVHEILEEQWKQEEGAARIFLQGLIQIAVAFHHLGNNNFHGATALLCDGLAKITSYQPAFLGVELSEFTSRLAVCQAEWQRLGPDACQKFSRELIPSLMFVR